MALPLSILGPLKALIVSSYLNFMKVHVLLFGIGHLHLLDTTSFNDSDKENKRNRKSKAVTKRKESQSYRSSGEIEVYLDSGGMGEMTGPDTFDISSAELRNIINQVSLETGELTKIYIQEESKENAIAHYDHGTPEVQEMSKEANHKSEAGKIISKTQPNKNEHQTHTEGNIKLYP